jgi:hypothetical protein
VIPLPPPAAARESANRPSSTLSASVASCTHLGRRQPSRCSARSRIRPVQGECHGRRPRNCQCFLTRTVNRRAIGPVPAAPGSRNALEGQSFSVRGVGQHCRASSVRPTW